MLFVSGFYKQRRDRYNLHSFKFQFYLEMKIKH